jgi:hypothetical protein
MDFDLSRSGDKLKKEQEKRRLEAQRKIERCVATALKVQLLALIPPTDGGWDTLTQT